MTDLDDEVRFHLAMRIEQLMRAGHSREDAERLARERLGDVDDLREYAERIDVRFRARRWWRRWPVDLVADARHGARQIRRSPGTSLTAVLTIALGIGATTATAAAVHRLLIQPVPGIDGNRIVQLSRTNEAGTFSVTPTLALFEAWRMVDGLAAAGYFTTREAAVSVTKGTAADRMRVGVMGPGLLDVFSVIPLRGRSFTADDDRGALVAEGWARTRFGGVDEALGQSVLVDKVAYTVIGVLPDRFVIPFSNANRLDVWMPAPRDGKGVFPIVLARLRPGLTDAVLREQLNAPMEAMADLKGQWLSRISRPQDDLGRSTKDSLLILFGAVSVVLLAGAVNVANLLLARAQARQGEFLVRRALGAGQGRLVRQLLTESALLASMGWACGIALAYGGLSLAQAYRPASLAALERVTFAPALLLASLGITGVTALLFGLAPALMAGSRRLAYDLRRQSLSASPDRRAARWRAGLVVAEVAMSALLLVGGGLLIRTLIEMRSAPLGFDPDGVYAVELDLPVDRYADAPARRALLDQVLPRLAAEPTIQAVAPAMGGPSQPGATFGALEVEGRPAPSTGGGDVLGFNAVAPGYFQLTGTPLIEGREFEDEAEPNIAIVSAALARRLQPNGSALGVRFRLDAKSSWQRVIGVAGDVTVPRPGGGGGLKEVMYVPFTASFRQAGFVLRTTGKPAGLQASVRGVVQSIDPAITVLTVQSAQSVADEAQELPRFIAGILTMFAAMAVVMSAIGLYGVIAYSVTRRRREIGIRIALGAKSADVLQSLVGTGLLLVAAGLVAGLGAAYFLAGSLRGVLFGVAPIDAVTFVAAASLVALVAGTAILIPAHRATGISPIAALREP